MGKYDDLERRWIRYKIKKILIIFIPLGIALGIASYFAFAYLTPKPTLEESNRPIPQKIEIIKEEKIEPQIKTPTVVIPDKTEEKIDKNLCFKVLIDILNIRERPTIAAEKVGKLYKDDQFCSKNRQDEWVKIDGGWVYTRGTAVILEEQQLDIEEIEVIDLLEPLGQESQTVNQYAFDAKDVNKEDMLDRLIKKYESSPNPKVAIEIGEIYLSNNDINSSLLWALRANELENSNASKILFAKAKYRSGAKEEAIKILETIRQIDNDQHIQRLIQEMRGQ